jgi:hypothetical protein
MRAMRNPPATPAPEADDASRAIADELVGRGLGPAARLLADAHRPLGPLLSDVGVALGALLGVAGGRATSGVRALMADERALERLVSHLDERAEEDDADRR